MPDAMQKAAQETKQAEKKEPGLFHRAVFAVWNENKERAPGEVKSTLLAFFREGLKDLRDWFNDPWQQQALAHTDEPGMPGVLTQIESTKERHPEMYQKEGRETIVPMQVKGKEIELG